MPAYRGDIGTLNIAPAGPVEAGSAGCWTLTYTAGKAGIAAGGMVCIGIPHGFSTPVIDNPFQAGYCTAACSREGVHLVLRCNRGTSNALDHRNGDYGSITAGVKIHVCEQGLETGDSITFRYGDRSAGSPGAIARQIDGPAVFTTLVCTTDAWRDDAHFYFIETPPVLQVAARKPERISVAVPSFAPPGTELPMTVTARDRFDNAAPHPDLTVELRGEGDLDGTVRMCRLENQATETSMPGHTAGVGRVHVAATAATEPAWSNPVRLENTDLNLYWGDLHCHTFLSDGLRYPAEAYELARRLERWDFAAITDHDYMTDEAWRHCQESAAEHLEDNRFVTFLAYEHSQPGIHRNVYSLDNKGLLVRTRRSETVMQSRLMGTVTGAVQPQHPSVETAAELYERLDPRSHMVIPHIHRMDWEHHDPRFEPVAEIYSCWGSREHSACRYASVAATRAVDTLQYALGLGYRIGFVGGGDGHAGRPGTDFWLRVRGARPCGITAIYAAQCTRQALWDALWSRHCYATTGKRIIVQFFVNDSMMGDEHRLTGAGTRRTIRAAVNGTAPLEQITLVKNNVDLHRASPGSFDAELSWKDETEARTGDYYYLRVEQKDGAMAWSSPVWLDVV